MEYYSHDVTTHLHVKVYERFRTTSTETELNHKNTPVRGVSTFQSRALF